MTTAHPTYNPLARYHEPIPRILDVYSRLALVQPIAHDDEVDWDDVQRVVENVLAELDAGVLSRLATVSSRPGANRSNAVSLYVYHVFDRQGADADPVVAGVAFIPTAAGILVRGDFCGEDSGRIYFEPPAARREVAARGRAVIGAADEVAAYLARHADELVEAIESTEEA